jgi:MFS family permease
MPKRNARRDHSVDYLGAAVLAGGTAALMLGLVWGGRDYAWSSLNVVGALATAAALLVLFAYVERRVIEPILPFDLLRDRAIASGVVSMTLVAMAMLGTIAFVPLFAQGVIGTSATASGVVLTPFMLSAVATSFVAGQWVSRSGRYKPNALVGPIVLGFALVLLARMGVHTTKGEAARNAVVAGIGVGLMMQVFVIAVQNSVPQRAIGSATALIQFARTIGGTLGVTLMGVIVSAGLPDGAIPEEASVRRLPPLARAELASALHPAFYASAGLCAAVLVIVALGMKEVPLRQTFEEATFTGELGSAGGSGAAAR